MQKQLQDGYSSLESINDDCLRYICQFLNIVDVVNMSSTCQRLLYFAEACIFRKKASKICIKIVMAKPPRASLAAPLDRTYTSQVKLEYLETAFSYVGEFVGDLTIVFKFSHQLWKVKPQIRRRYFVALVENCQNLTTLRIENDEFTERNTHALQSLVENFQNLKELDVSSCIGLTKHWRAAALNQVSTVKKLSLSVEKKFSSHFVKYFQNLDSLHIHFLNLFKRKEDIVQINIT